MIILDLPFPPSMNTYWRKFRNIMVLSQAARDYKQAVAEYVIENNVPKLGDSRLELRQFLTHAKMQAYLMTIPRLMF